MFLKRFTSSAPPTDLELVRHYQQTGDLACVGELFQRHTEMVYLVCLKYLKDQEESKDATMQVFENLIVSLRKHEVSTFKSWLHSITKNHCLMLLRAQKTKGTAFINEAPLLEKSMPPYFVEEEQEDHELALQTLEHGLSSLGEEQRTCVELFYLQQKSYKEIAALTGYDPGKVKSHIQNGKRNLMIYMRNKL